jgi:nuclear transport factor 2 (NTF2) superfamily protein
MVTATSGKSNRAKKRPRRLSAAAAKRFLTRYKEAWETRNADLAASLFTRDAHYWENPFGEAIVGREAIHAYWQSATSTQQDIRFVVSNFFHHAYTLVAEWTCAFRRKPGGEKVELAGMMFADFYGDQVRTFREYWHRRAG